MNRTSHFLSSRRVPLARLLVQCLLFACAVGWVGAGPAVWQAGVAKVKITPTEPIWLAGYGARTNVSQGVRQDIFAKALAVQDASAKPAVLVTLDLVSIEPAMIQAVAERCRNEYGLERAQLLFNVSHTHSGPVAGMTTWPMYELSAEQSAVVRRYTEKLMDNVVAVIGAALKDLAPCKLSYKQGLSGIAVNRRRLAKRYLPGPVDHDVPVLKIQAPDGSLRAVVAGYACHATVLSDYLINGDWPGYALAELEKNHPGATALFVQGCGADSNPLPRRTVELAQKYGEILCAAVDEVLAQPMPELAGPLKTVFECVEVPFQTPPTRQELEARLKDKNHFIVNHARQLLAELARDGKLPTSYPYPVQVWQFGSKLKLIALGGEVVVDYSLRLKAQHGWDNTWVAGYSNDVLGYIPSVRVLKEGGYEGGDAMTYFGRPGPFAEAVEETIIAKVAELVERSKP